MNTYTQAELERAKKLETQSLTGISINMKDAVWLGTYGNDILHTAYPSEYEKVFDEEGRIQFKKIKKLSMEEKKMLSASAEKFDKLQAIIKRDRENEEGL